MEKSRFAIVTKLLAGAALLLAAPLALASGQPNVSWSISVGSTYPAPQVYSPPQVVYVQPQPVYVRPQPVYVQPQPVFVGGTVVQYSQPYYYEEFHPRKFGHHHWRPHHHHHRHFND